MLFHLSQRERVARLQRCVVATAGRGEGRFGIRFRTLAPPHRLRQHTDCTPHPAYAGQTSRHGRSGTTCLEDSTDYPPLPRILPLRTRISIRKRTLSGPFSYRLVLTLRLVISSKNRFLDGRNVVVLTRTRHTLKSIHQFGSAGPIGNKKRVLIRDRRLLGTKRHMFLSLITMFWSCLYNSPIFPKRVNAMTGIKARRKANAISSASCARRHLSHVFDPSLAPWISPDGTMEFVSICLCYGLYSSFFK